ncbi:hypothetical protein GCM10017714_32530 [Curtobacterium pusillum]|nr:hypothetical protein GCM10017610_19980 [Curtobacterium pusillum]
MYGPAGAGASSVEVEVGVGAAPQPAGPVGYERFDGASTGCASPRSEEFVGVLSVMGRVHTGCLCAADDDADASLCNAA